MASGATVIDDAQLIQRFLKEVGIEAELKIQEYGAYVATTVQGKYEGLVRESHRHRLGTGSPAVSRLCRRLHLEHRPRQ